MAKAHFFIFGKKTHLIYCVPEDLTYCLLITLLRGKCFEQLSPGHCISVFFQFLTEAVSKKQHVSYAPVLKNIY